MRRGPLDVQTECPRAWRDRPRVSRDGRPIWFALSDWPLPQRLKQALAFSKLPAQLDPLTGSKQEFDGFLDFGPGKGYVEVQYGHVRPVMARDVLADHPQATHV